MSTDHLFAQPSFRSGVASIIDIEGMTFYNTSQTPEEADHRAIESDWGVVGLDLRGALDSYGQ